MATTSPVDHARDGEMAKVVQGRPRPVHDPEPGVAALNHHHVHLGFSVGYHPQKAWPGSALSSLLRSGCLCPSHPTPGSVTCPRQGSVTGGVRWLHIKSHVQPVSCRPAWGPGSGCLQLWALRCDLAPLSEASCLLAVPQAHALGPEL